MEVVFSVVSGILNKLVDEAIVQASYPFRFRKYVKDLETEKENLHSKIEEVLDRAKEAKKKTHKVDDKVEKWLNEADFLMAKVVELQEKTEKRNKTLCLKHCRNLISRYNLAKQLVVKINEIKAHNQVQFSKFSRLATLVGMNYFSSQDFVHFDSRKVSYDGLLKALEDDKIRMIGLYGMGGCGKTTLVQEVGKRSENVFDKVVFVVVSNTIDVGKIQSKIASQIKLTFEEEDTSERAQRLYMRLSSGERFLIILDDVWEKLNFMDIGIPTGNNQTGCTTLITTRKFHVCELMNCQKIIPLEGLNEAESWTLFQKHAELYDDESDTLKGVAQEITKECGGLPVAIAAIATSLRGKPCGGWIEALKTLRDPNWIEIEDNLKSVFGCLRLSYDNLESEVAKSLFLLCSIYPEDYGISIDELTVVGLGLGLAGETPSYRARIQIINKAMKRLVDSCLLLKVLEDGSLVKMHDLIRDVALWIGKKEIKFIEGQLREDMIINDHAIRYLWLENFDKFPNMLNYVELEYLRISLNLEPCVTVPKDFFNGMQKLRVLSLVGATASSLQFPIPLHLINNLCVLLLGGWALGDISFIGSLERLESLTILYCSFEELPKCIIQQKKLRSLTLNGCEIQGNPFGVMGRCSQLEALLFWENHGKDWEDQNTNSAEFFDDSSTNTLALESYCIQFGSQDKLPVFENDLVHHNWFAARSLYIEDFENCISIAKSRDMMRRAKTLSLRGVSKSCKNIIPDLWRTIGGGMNDLTQLALHDSDGIECVMGHVHNLSQVGTISNLTHLTLINVKHLKSLYSGQPPQGLFANLEDLFIGSCDSLVHILTEDAKEIVDGSEYQSHGNAFPKLKSLRVHKCNKLEYLMPISFAKSLSNLEDLSVFESEELRSLFGHSLYEDLNVNNPQIIEFSSLKELVLIALPNIIIISPENYHPKWPSLKGLRLDNCPQLNIKSINHWVTYGGLGQGGHTAMSFEDILKGGYFIQLETLQNLFLSTAEVEIVFDVDQLPINGHQIKSSLRFLSLTRLPRLRHIWWGSKNSVLLQHLLRLSLVSCGNLKVVFSSSVLKSLPQLLYLFLEDCNELEEIIEDDQNLHGSCQILFPRLVSIVIHHCHKLKCVLPKISVCRMIPNLKILVIENASLLEQVFGYEPDDAIHTTLEYVVLSNLPSLTSIAPSITFKTVKYIVEQKICPKIAITSTVTPQELLKELSKVEAADYSGYSYETIEFIEHLQYFLKSMDESSRKSEGQSNDQKLSFIASPNLAESVEGMVEECSTSENVQMVTSLAHSEAESSTKSASQIFPDLEMPTAMPTSSLQSQPINNQQATEISIHKTCFHETEIVNMISTSQSDLKDQQQQSLAIVEITNKSIRDLGSSSSEKEKISRENDAKGGSKEPQSSVNSGIIAPSTLSKSANSLPDILNTSSAATVPCGQCQISQKETCIDKEMKKTPISNLQDLIDDDLISLLQSMEDDYGGKSSTLSVPTHDTPKDELVSKALIDLEDSLKKPLKDIATSEANCLRLQTALNFLSRLSLEDGALPHGVMALIKSIHKDFPTILSSFNQAYGTVNKFEVLQQRDKSVKGDLTQRKVDAIALVSKMSEAEKFMDEAQEKEASLKKQISKLEKEREECEAKLLSLQEQKRKRIAEATELKNEIESVSKDKSEMVEAQSNARQQLFQADYKWSVLGSQFEQHIANRNLS